MDKTWEAPGGFLGFSARFARTGIQMYDGAEIDPDGEHKLTDGARRFKPGTLYPVERPAEEVFSNRALASFIAKPLTNDHPAQGVDIENWRDLTGGVIGETLRDGEYARLSGLMTDKALIADYRAGKKELSGGYSAKLVIGDGVNAKGEAFVAKQTEIDGNHVAFVTRGRAGSECRVVDAAPCAAAPTAIFDSLTNDGESIVTTKTITFDGLPLLVTDAAEAAIGKLQAQIATLTTDKATLETNVATLTTDKATLEAEKVTLTKQVADAALTPAQLRDAAKSYATVIGKAQAMGVTVADSMDEPAIKRAVVDKALGDLAKGWNDVQVDASFASLTKDAKVADTAVQPLGAPVVHDGAKDATDARAAMIADMLKPTTAAA